MTANLQFGPPDVPAGSGWVNDNVSLGLSVSGVAVWAAATEGPVAVRVSERGRG